MSERHCQSNGFDGDVIWRVIMQTDATVVRLLEAVFGEGICTAGLEQSVGAPRPHEADLELDDGASVLRRATVLQGERSSRSYVYAETSIAIDRLPEALRAALLGSSATIGSVLVGDRIETFREVLRTGEAPAGERAPWFELDRDERLLFRTYRMFVQGKPAMLITEHFPRSLLAPGLSAGLPEKTVRAVQR